MLLRKRKLEGIEERGGGGVGKRGKGGVWWCVKREGKEYGRRKLAEEGNKGGGRTENFLKLFFQWAGKRNSQGVPTPNPLFNSHFSRNLINAPIKKKKKKTPVLSFTMETFR